MDISVTVITLYFLMDFMRETSAWDNKHGVCNKVVRLLKTSIYVWLSYLRVANARNSRHA